MTNSWPLLKLGLLVDTIVPQRDKPHDLTGSIPWLRIEDFSGKYLHTSKSGQGVSSAQVQSMPLRVFPAGTVVTSCSCTMGATAIASQDLITNQTFIGLVPREGELTSDFLYYLMQAKADELQAQATGAIQQYLSKEDFRRIRFRLPSVPEQRAIASFLDHETAEIDAFIADQQELIGLLNERRAATITQAVTKGLDPNVPMKDSGVEWLRRVPQHWSIRRLWTLFQREKNVGHPNEEMLSVFRDHGVVVKASRNNLNKTAENRNIYQLVDPGWLVTNRMKAWQGSVGISSVRGIVSGHYICFRPVHNQNSDYLNRLFRSAPYAAGYGQISRGVRIGQAEIDNDHYRQLEVLLPPLDEQQQIADHLDRETAEIDAAIADAKEAIELSKERRAALISAAVTGKIDVRDHPAAKGAA